MRQPGSTQVNLRGPPAVIDSKMSIAEILGHLIHHGCKDVTSQIDAQKSSEFPISTGGFGDVYRAALLDGSPVGLKCLRLVVGANKEGEKGLKRAAHELYIWSKCKHRNVVELIGVAQYRDRIAMVSPWMENGDLRDFLSREANTDRPNICVQIADAVAYLHSMKIIHGDIKAANVLVSRDHTPKLADFGSSKLGVYTLQFTTTTSGPGMSLRWTAPELLEDQAKPSDKADVYALGMTMLEIITGTVPYDDMSDVAVMRRIVEKIPPTRPKEHIPTNDKQADLLWVLLTKCWSSDPPARPTAAEVRDEMRTVAQARLEPAGTQFGTFIRVPNWSRAWTNLVGQLSPGQAVSHSERATEGLLPSDN